MEYNFASMTIGASTAPQGFEQWTIRGLIARHKLASLAVAGLLAVMVIPFVVVAVGSKGGAVTDATTCTQWGSTNQTGQTAYSRLFFREHGPVREFGGSATSVIRAINWGCGVAYGDDVSDMTTVVQAIKGNY